VKRFDAYVQAVRVLLRYDPVYRRVREACYGFDGLGICWIHVLHNVTS
jgi:hypothetical protein